MKTLTVFTPTYNRKNLLPVLYAGLCSQTSKDFLWLIVDDGSSDGTKELVDEWTREGKVEIEYYFKKNGGMHTAHNLAYKKIKTELNVCIDSDDSMPADAVENILLFWKNVKNKKEVSGIIALDSDFEGNVLGTELPETDKPVHFETLYKKYRISGDKKLIYRTSVINEVPEYPEYENERLVPLSYKYWRADRKYPFAVMNKTVCLVNYQADGSSATIKKQYFQSPRGFLAAKKDAMVYPRIFSHQIKATIHYIFFNKMLNEKGYIKKSPKKLLTILLLPLGIVYYKKAIGVKKDSL